MNALFSAELLKLQRQPGVLFWGFLSVPAAALAFKVALESFFFLRSGNFPQGHADTLLSAAQSLGIAGNPIAQLLYAIGISSVFFIEYRFSTWRNLVPRAGRIPLLAAKFAVCLLCMVIGLVLTIVGDMILNTALSFLGGGTSSKTPIHASGIFVLSAAFVIAFLELASLAAIVATLTIIFRSMIAAVIPVFLVGITCSILQAYFGAAIANLPMPSIAADTGRAWLFAGAEGQFGTAGFGTLLAWFLAVAVIGSVAFWRQSLSTE
ncbi:ABC transporter permease [Mesorhizobium sp.]|uniref:ABC transporter permease n=1 Tax=Mesorhizobium sp. TaxID=1871066 RepID=UPI0025C4D125|nr:ABC transporter permease [Mesorhizobium sp.]